jgi:hypothetical protein
MNSQDLATASNNRKEYVLAEFRCAIVKARLALLDLEAASLALKAGIVTPEQAVAMFWDSQAVQFLGLELGAEAGPDTSSGRREAGMSPTHEVLA